MGNYAGNSYVVRAEFERTINGVSKKFYTIGTVAARTLSECEESAYLALGCTGITGGISAGTPAGYEAVFNQIILAGDVVNIFSITRNGAKDEAVMVTCECPPTP